MNEQPMVLLLPAVFWFVPYWYSTACIALCAGWLQPYIVLQRALELCQAGLHIGVVSSIFSNNVLGHC
jgi:hypothetical protein